MREGMDTLRRCIFAIGPGTGPGPALSWAVGPFGCMVDVMNGLTSVEAATRLQQFGPNRLNPPRQRAVLLQFLAQFGNPLVLILLVAIGVSALTGDVTFLDATVEAIAPDEATGQPLAGVSVQ